MSIVREGNHTKPPEQPVPVIAIDGPGGSGKGTVSKIIAQRLGWHLLDSGILYRLVALASINHSIDQDNEAALEVIAGALDVHFEAVEGEEGVRAILEGEDVSDTARSEDVGLVASRVAALPSVRQALLARQRAFAEMPGLVADGRDMGTIVFPEAPVKIFLTAGVQARANRRYKQLLERGQNVNLARLVEAIEARDRQDAERTVAPLRPADEAIVIDSTSMTVSEVVDSILQAAKSAGVI